MNYTRPDFEIRAFGFEHVAEGKATFKVRVQRSPVGEMRDAVIVPYEEAALKPVLDKLGGQGRKVMSGAELIVFGKALAALLFPPDVRTMWEKSRLWASMKKEGLRLRLMVSDARLARLPWEYVYLQKEGGDGGGFLALDPRLSIVRHEQMQQDLGSVTDAEPPLRVLAAFAQPKGLAELDQATVRDSIKAALDAEHKSNQIDLSFLEHLRKADLAAPGKKYDLFSFSGHGDFLTEERWAFHRERFRIKDPASAPSPVDRAWLKDRLAARRRPGQPVDPPIGTRVKAGGTSVTVDRSRLKDRLAVRRARIEESRKDIAPRQGMLVFENADGGPDFYPAAILAKQLLATGVRVVVVDACYSAKIDRAGEQSVGAALVQEGIPGVIGMQFGFSDPAAEAFWPVFYASVAAGLSLDEAVYHGRLAIVALAPEPDEDDPTQLLTAQWDFGFPALYMRATDGVLFPRVAQDPDQRARQRELLEQQALLLKVTQKARVGENVIGIDADGVTSLNAEVLQEFDTVTNLMGIKIRGSGGTAAPGQPAGRGVGRAVQARSGATPPELAVLDRLLQKSPGGDFVFLYYAPASSASAAPATPPAEAPVAEDTEEADADDGEASQGEAGDRAPPEAGVDVEPSAPGVAPLPQGDLFFDAVVHTYLHPPRFHPDNPDRFVERPWLADAVREKLQDPACRFLLLDAEPGAGKSSFLAQLRRDNPDWPVYFIQRDQRTPLGDVGPHSFLLHLGYQLAALYPQLFEPEHLKLSVEQRIGQVSADGEVVGVEIDRLLATPFYQTVVKIRQEVRHEQGDVTGLKVGELVVDPRLIPLSDLQYLALIDPARALLRVKPEARLVILVDALDELRYHSGGETLFTWMTNAPSLPENIRFVLTGRPPGAVWEVFAERRAGQVEVLALEPGYRAEVDEDLLRYAGRLAARPSVARALGQAGLAADTFKSAAVAKADGNIGYLDALERGFDEAVRRGGERAQQALLRLEQVPGDLESLNAFFLNQVRARVGKQVVERVDAQGSVVGQGPAWIDVYKKILGVLSVAREPLTLAQIQTLGGINVFDEGSVAVALEDLWQFLDHLGDRYQLYHASMAAFLTRAETASAHRTLYVDAVRWNRRLADHFWPEREADWRGIVDYGLNHLAAHLYESDDYARLQALISKAWMRERYVRNGFTYVSFLADVDLAWQSARKKDDLVAQVRMMMARKVVEKKAGMYTDVDLQTLVWLSRKEEALGYARVRGSVEERCAGVRAVCSVLGAQGVPEPALLAEAEAVARTIRVRSEHVEAMADIALALAQVDDEEAAARAAALFEEVEKKAGGESPELERVAYALARAGRFEAAVRVAGKAGGPFKTSAQCEIAARMAQAAQQARTRNEEQVTGLFAQAEALADTIEDVPWKVRALSAVARSREQAGDTSEAAALFRRATSHARSISPRWRQALPLAAVAVAAAQAGDKDRAAALFEEAVTLAQARRNPPVEGVPPPLFDDLTESLFEQAVALAEDGNYTEATKRFREVQEKVERLGHYAHERGQVVSVLAQTGLWERIEELLPVKPTGAKPYVNHPDSQATTQVAVTTAQAQAGRLDEAAARARTITGTAGMVVRSKERAEALSAVALAMAKAGKDQETEVLLKEAHEALPVSWSALGAVAVVWARAGDHDAAETLFDEVQEKVGTEGGGEHAEYRGQVVQLVAQAGLWERIEQLLPLKPRSGETPYVNHPDPQAKAYVAVAAALAQAGRLDEAEQRARAITWWPKHGFKARALSAVAAAQAQANKEKAEALFQEAEALADKEASDDHKAATYGAIGQARGRARHWDEAEKLANKIPVDNDPYRDKGQVLKVLVTGRARAGHWNKAKELAGKITNGLQEDEAQGAIVAARAEAGFLEPGEIEALTKIDGSYLRAEALGAIAAELALAGREEQATALFEQAEQALQSLTHEGKNRHTLGGLSSTMARAQRFEDALRVASPLDPDDFLCVLAAWSPYLEQVEPGLSVAASRAAIDIANALWSA